MASTKSLNNTSTPRVHPYAGIAAGVLAISAAPIIVRLAQSDAPSIVIAAGRLSLAALVLTPFALTRHRGEIRALSRRDLAWAAASGLFLGIHFATWITSLEYTSVASSVVLVSTSPLFVALMGTWALREYPSRRLASGMLVALAGGAVVGLSGACAIGPSGVACALETLGESRSMLGNALALAGAVAGASYLLIGRHLRAKLSLIPYVFLVYAVAAVVLWAGMLASGHTPLGYSAKLYLWLVLLALVPQLIGHSMFNWALRYLPAAYVSVTVLGEPIGSTWLAFVLLGERPSPIMLVGGLLILTGIVFASSRPARPIIDDA